MKDVMAMNSNRSGEYTYGASGHAPELCYAAMTSGAMLDF